MKINNMKDYMLSKEKYFIDRYLYLLRREENFKSKNGLINNFFNKFYERKKNKLGIKLGFVIPAFTLKENVKICHIGNIIINSNAVIGNNCKLHGSNCIGNKGTTQDSPIIGNNVDIGFGAILIGNIKISDNCKIGAGAVVTNSFETPGATIVGIPAIQIER